MQVRKFEARTMKEALDMVKSQMGPEAIILSAKDNHKGFGLIGGTSVEVTAAITNETLKRKLLAEKKMREEARQRFQRASAKEQRQFIEKAFNRPSSSEKAPIKRPLTATPYIEIGDESPGESSSRLEKASVAVQANPRATVEQGGLNQVLESPLPSRVGRANKKSERVMALEAQIEELKSMIEKFSRVPQTFIGGHPGADEGIPYHLCEVYQRLLKIGIDQEIVVKAIRKAQSVLGPVSSKKSALVEAWIVQFFMKNLEVNESISNDRYQVFVGSTGQGKTTSLVKMASHLLLKEKKRIAIVSLDTLKVGASDQLKIYAQILNVPFAVVRKPEDWSILESKLDRIDYILVDAPGFTLKEESEKDWLQKMLPPTKWGRRVHWTQSIVARDEDVMGLAERYSQVGFDDVIFTRVDESSRQGMVINFQTRFKKSILAFGTGVRIPEDFQWANKERIIDLIFRITG